MGPRGACARGAAGWNEGVPRLHAPACAPRLLGMLGAATLLALAACGGDATPQEVPVERPPTWCAARDEGSDSSLLLDVKAGDPCRLRVRILGVPEGTAEEQVRDLAAGESVRLWVSAGTEDQARASAPVSEADAAAGRREAWVARLAYGWADRTGGRRTQVVGARPGQGRVLGTWLAAPPRAPRTLALGEDLDLAAVALADGGTGLVLQGAEQGSRVRGPPAGTGDRVTLLRIVVRAEKMGS